MQSRVIGCKIMYLEILHLEMRIPCYNVKIILIHGKKCKNFKQGKTFSEGATQFSFRNFMIRIIFKFSKNISWVSFFYFPLM